MVLDNIDNNSNKQIEAKELHNAIKAGFFDKQENIDAIKKELESNRSKIAISLKTILEKQYNEINNKPFKNEIDKKILGLYNALSQNNPIYTHNNLINKKNTAKKLNTRPKLHNIDRNLHVALRKVVERSKDKYSDEYTKLLVRVRKQKHHQSPDIIEDYVRYESIIWAIQKYYEELQQENNQLLKKHGFYSKRINKSPEFGEINTEIETFGGRDFMACISFFEFLEEDTPYPLYEEDQKNIQEYNKDTESIFKNRGYWGNDKFKKHTQTYKNFEKEVSNKSDQINYNDSIQYLAQNNEPKDQSEESIKEYMDHVQNTIRYSQEYENISKKYGPKLLEGYIGTVQDISKLEEKYPGVKQSMSRMQNYNMKLEQKKEGLGINNQTIRRYMEYNKEAGQKVFPLKQRCGLLMEKVQKEIQGKSDNSFIFPEIKEHLKQEQKKQANIDNIWNTIKILNPLLYKDLNFLTGMWNGGVDATIGVGTGLGLLITSLYQDTDETVGNLDLAHSITSFFKIGQSSAQLEPPVKDGKFNLNFDNGAAILGAQVSNMLILLSGAGLIGSSIRAGGAKVGLNIAETVARRGGLFTWASMQGMPNTFQEYIGEGLDKATAWKYALGSTVLTSSLEMIAPNDMFFKAPSIKTIITQLGAKQTAKRVAKKFAVNLSREVVEEIGQESLQLSVERIINNHINTYNDTDLETSLSMADFATTAILTALTTGIVSSKGSYQVSKNTINKSATILWIASDSNKFTDYTNKLNQIIQGKKKYAGISKENAQTILNQINSTRKYLKGEAQEIQSQENTELQQLKEEVMANETSEKTDQETEQSIREVESDQTIFKKPTELEEANTTKEKISVVNKIKAKLYVLAEAWSAGSEYDFTLNAANHVIKNVEHFWHEFTTIFGMQLFDLYGTFIEMKNHKGQPGDAEFQKLFQKKAKERGKNTLKLFGVAALAKLGIDPHLFFRSGHLIAGELQKHIKFFDKLFGLSFQTMDSLYGWKEGNKTKYNPEQVITNSKLDDATKKELMTDILQLDPNNPEHQALLDALIQAHKVGQGEAGKNPEYSAGVYNYTTAQIRAKYALLKPFIDTGMITHTQVKFLFDMGFLGSKPESLQQQSESLQNNKQILEGISEKVKKQEQLKNPKAKKMKEFLERIQNNTYKMKDGVFESLEGLRNTFKKTLTMPEILVLWQTIAQANNIDMNEQLDVQGVLTEMGFEKQLTMEYQADMEPVDIDAYKKEMPKNMTPEQKIKFANIMANVEQYLSSIEQDNGFISDELKHRMRKVAANYASNMLMSSFNTTLNNESLFKKVQEFANNLIFQEIGDKLIMAGSDHGIKHVTNDAFGGLKLVELLHENNLFENDMDAIDTKVMLIQIIMDHDMGYNMKFFERISKKLGNGEITDRFELIDALTDHPVFSAGRVAQNRAKYEAIYGDKFTMMMDAMIDHSDVRVEYGPSDNPKSTLFTKEMDFATKLKLMISIPDCLAAFRGDKGRELWGSPVMMNHLHKLNQFNRLLEDVQKMIKNEQDPALKERLLQQESALKEKKNVIKQKMIHDIEKVTTDPKKQEQYKQALENSFDVGDIKYPTKYNFGSYTGDIAGGGLQNSLNLVPVKSESGEIIGYKPSVEVNIYQDTMRNVGNAESKKVATSSINKIMDDFGIQEIRDKVDSTDSKTGETTKVFPEMKITIDGKEKIIKNGDMFYAELTNQSNLGKTIQIEGPSMIFNLTLQEVHPESAEVNQNMEKRVHLDNINNSLLGNEIFSNRETDFRDENGNQNRKKQMTQQVKGLKINDPSVLNMVDNIHTKMQKRATESDPSIKSTLEADAKISINELTIEVLNTTNDNIDIK